MSNELSTSSYPDHEIGTGTLLLAHAGHPCDATLHSARKTWVQTLHLPGETVIIGAHRRGQLRLASTRDVTPLNESALTAILAFVDIALGRPINAPEDTAFPTRHAFFEPFPLKTLDEKPLQNWLLLKAVRGEPCALLHYLRAHEPYLLTRYLLESPTNLHKVAALCKKYGLSYTQFRRLCIRALGGSLKEKLRSWRGARCVLQLLEKRLSILDVAIEHGYVSNSHICKDLKELFGVTPSIIMKGKSLLP